MRPLDRLVSVLDPNPNLKELSTFVELNEANVFRGDRVDPDQLERLMRAVDRYGQTIVGYQLVPEYTARPAGMGLRRRRLAEHGGACRGRA